MSATAPEKTKTSTPPAEKPKTPAAEKPKAASKPAAAAPVSNGPSGKALAEMLAKQLKERIGKTETVTKQTYFRLMKDGDAVCYVHTHKKHARISLSVDVSDASDVAAVVGFIEQAIVLQKKAKAA